jgi:hypothetical protein
VEYFGTLTPMVEMKWQPNWIICQITEISSTIPNPD